MGEVACSGLSREHVDVNFINYNITMAQPKFSDEEAAAIAREHFALNVSSVSNLPSYDDQNFRLHCGESDFVLKIAAAGADCRGFADAETTRGQLQLENDLMGLLAKDGVCVPCLQQTTAGEEIHPFHGENGGDGQNFVRIISFLPGNVLAKVDHTDAMLTRFGRCLGRMDSAMEKFDNEHAHRDLTWDLANAARVRNMLGDIEDEKNRELAAKMLGHFEAAQPTFAELPKQVVHGDANDYNVLVTDEAFAALSESSGDCAGIGVLDFGDAVYTQRICNLAVALAYVAQNKKSGEEALNAAVAVTHGYRQANALSSEELALLYVCIIARLVQSVVMSAHSVKLEPENAEYLLVNAKPGWDLLWQWADLDLEVAAAAFSA